MIAKVMYREGQVTLFEGQRISWNIVREQVDGVADEDQKEILALDIEDGDENTVVHLARSSANRQSQHNIYIMTDEGKTFETLYW